MARDERAPQILRGRALRAAVRAAETPGLGALMRGRFLTELGVDRLLDEDLRDQPGRPALLPFVAPEAPRGEETPS